MEAMMCLRRTRAGVAAATCGRQMLEGQLVAWMQEVKVVVWVVGAGSRRRVAVGML